MGIFTLFVFVVPLNKEVEVVVGVRVLANKARLGTSVLFGWFSIFDYNRPAQIPISRRSSQ